MRYCVVLVTAPRGGEAKKLARLVLGQKLAACVNIIKGVDSLFWWGGKVDAAREDLMVLKTRRALLPALTRVIKKAHSYSVCEVVALAVVGGNKPYLDWVGASCRTGKDGHR